jgi:hypothetical protein
MLSELKANEPTSRYAGSGSSASSNQAQLAPATSFPLAASPLNQEESAPASSNAAQLFDSSSGNTVTDSHVNVAARDLINVSVFVNPHPPPPTTSQQTPGIPKPPDQSGVQWPSILWKFRSPFLGTAVTLHTPESASVDSLSKPQAKPSISPDPIDRQPFLVQKAPAPEARPSQANEQAHREAYPSGSKRKDNSPQPRDAGSDVVSIRATIILARPLTLLKLSLEGLEMGDKYREAPFALKLANRSKASNKRDVYIRNIYPSGHGYPCADPWPLGPPVGIGDVGILTSIGFVCLTNLYDCQSLSLQDHLSSLPPLSEVWRNPEYLSEGESVFGGVSDCEPILSASS